MYEHLETREIPEAPLEVLLQDFVDYMKNPDEEPKLYMYNLLGFRKALTKHIQGLVDIANGSPEVANELRQILTQGLKQLEPKPLKHAGRLPTAPHPDMYPEIHMEDVLILN